MSSNVPDLQCCGHPNLTPTDLLGLQIILQPFLSGTTFTWSPSAGSDAPSGSGSKVLVHPFLSRLELPFSAWVFLDPGVWTQVGFMSLVARLYEANMAIGIDAVCCMALWVLNAVVMGVMPLYVVIGPGGLSVCSHCNTLCEMNFHYC